MLNQFTSKLKNIQRDFAIFLLVGVFLGIAQSIDGSAMNNFYKEKFDVVLIQRTLLEIPRELPGFLVFFLMGLLHMLGDVRISVVANILAAVGMFALGIIPANYGLMLFFILIYSTGQHLYMPLANSIGMSFANDANIGRKLGQINAANSAALVISSAFFWLLFRYFKVGYTVTFTIGAIAFLIASVLLLMMNPKQTVGITKRFVFRKEYKLYYWLCVLYGARKQIFITFGPWVLVDVFGAKVTTMTVLFFIVSTLSIFVKPLIGSMIDKIGEKFVLGSEAGVLIIVCLTYAFAEDIFPRNIAILAVCVCYVLDLVANAVGMARSTYMRKIAVNPEDVSPTLSLGISIDHMMSMFIPILGGLLWYNNGAHGYKYVFLCGAIIAVVNFISTRKMEI